MTRLMLRDLPRYECLLEASKQFPELNPSAFVAYLHLLRAGDELFRVATAHFGRNNMSQGRFVVLMLLIKQEDCDEGCCDPLSKPGPMTLAELAEQANCTRPTMTGLVDTLERDGMVKRVPSEADRRSVEVRLTDYGRETILAMLPNHFKRVTELMSDLSDDECALLVRLLGKVSERAALIEPLDKAASGK